MRIGEVEVERPCWTRRKTGRKDWSGFEFTQPMIEAARANYKNTGTLWMGLKESGYLDAAIAAGGGEI